MGAAMRGLFSADYDILILDGHFTIEPVVVLGFLKLVCLPFRMCDGFTFS